ncbi:MAG: hypothetical protein ACD_56C00141G0005 [uncultured bacterium]|nr:MAG: hypothetical protein ACD_56C00141G0005 [uncultured bacterium]
MHSNDSNLHSIVCLAHRVEGMANKYIFLPMGLSSTSVKILGMLSHHAFLTPSQIIEMSSSTKSNISQRLSFLEKEGLIARDYASDRRDKRKVKVTLTSKGKEKMKEIQKVMHKAKLSVEKEFSEKEMTAHKAFIKKLNGVLDNSESKLTKLFKL